MALQVIGAGLGRTGTLSLKLALEDLGFVKCYHMTEVIAHPEHAPVWDAAARGEAVDWDALFEGYRAAVDWPPCRFYAELMQCYPEAKVILTVRDADRWYDSALRTIYHARRTFARWPMPLLPRMRAFERMLDRLIWDGTFDGRFEDKAHAIAVYDRHNDEVRRRVPPERLLVFEVKQGWGPLCAFLGVPEPADRPFPHVNDTEEFRARIGRMLLVARAVACGAAAVVVLVLVALAVRIFA